MMPIAATLLLMNGAYAQEGTRSTKDPQRGTMRERAQQAQGLSPMAGSPQAQWDSIGAPFVPDTAFESILLDRSQAKRIVEMDRRYSEAFRDLGTADRSDPRYQQMWMERSGEIEGILTPTQYDRWQELNAGHLGEPKPVDMPVMKPAENIAPMPTMRVDSTNDPMPMVPDTLRITKPPQRH